MRVAVAIVALVALVAVAWLARADAPAPAKRTAPVGFDHAFHATSAGECTKCHALDRGIVAKPPGHGACFTSACHVGVVPKLEKLESVTLCVACHAQTALVLPLDKKALAVTKNVAQVGIEHALQLGHNSHAKTPCTLCHDVRPGAKPARRPHDRCLACHGDKPEKTFAITACAKCHPKGSDTPRFADKQIVVTSAFSHAKHATRGAARQCVTCHASVAATDDRRLPRPELATCSVAGCHDGTAAFHPNASCTKCHKDVPKTKFDVARPAKAYSHERHEARAPGACASCHPLGKSGEILIAGHSACATGTCHPNEMGQREPTICNACHDGTEPWRSLVADKLPAEVSEFGSTLEHQKHPGTCASCHSLTTTRTELRTPRGHRACASAGCHAVTGGPTPQLTACATCHVRNLDETRRSNRLTARWSVRATFVHRSHAAKAGDVACEQCHSDLRSPTVLSLGTPAKATCATEKCHDGTAAFKVTGTACTRCHPGAPPK